MVESRVVNMADIYRWLLMVLMVAMVTDSASSQQTTMLVAPRTELCADKTETCKTLTQYRDEGMLSRSNVLWKFRSGSTPHLLLGGLYVFSKVSNVSLVCEYPGNCQLKCTLSGGQMCIFLFLEATNVSLDRFTIRYTVKTTRPITIQRQNILDHIPGLLNMEGNCTSRKQCSYINSTTANRSWVFINCTDINISGVHFIGPQNSWAVVRPRGRFTVKNCSFIKLSSGLWEYDRYNTSNDQNHIIVVVEFPGQKQCKKTQLVLTIDNTSFEGVGYLPTTPRKGRSYPVIHIRSKCQLKVSNVNITISSCVFKKCPAVEVDVLDNPGVTIKMDKCSIDGNVTKSFAKKWLYDNQMFFSGSAIRLHLCNVFTNGKRKYTCLPGFLESNNGINITRNKFTNLASGQGSAIVIFSSGLLNCSIRSVTIQSNIFKFNYGLYYRSIIYGTDSVIDEGNSRHQQRLHNATGYRIILRSNTLKKNFKEAWSDKRCVVYRRAIPNYISQVHTNKSYKSYVQSCFWQAVIYLSGYSNWKVLMEENEIKFNYEGGLKLYRSVVQLRGRNRIQNCTTSYGGGIGMVGDSQLLIEENAILEIVRNRAFVRGGGFFIQDLCILKYEFSDTCPCFFQLVDRNGTMLERSSVHSLNRSVVLSENTVWKMGTAKMMFNSNIDRCVFRTNFMYNGNGNKSGSEVNIEVFQELFNLRTDHAYKASEISSIPRKICMCGESGQIVTCDLENHPPLKYYPGQRLKVNIAILGDMDIHLSNVLYVDLEKSTYFNRSEVYIPLYLVSTHVLESKCNEIILPPLPMIRNSASYNYYLQLRIPLLRDTLVQETGTTYLTDFIRTSRHNKFICPDGFEFNSEQNECQCHPRLREYGFECSLDDLAFQLPEKLSAYWIGRMKEFNGTNVFWSLNCVRVFCNIITHIPIDKYDVQCKHNRTGVLCGQCPQGYSTVLWSDRCEECTNWSLLLLLVLLLGCPLFITIIGALNLTITVGAMNGFMYYATIMAINFQEFRLIYFIGNSLKTCLYNGMTEFGRTLFTYFLPLYLLLLVGIACCLPKCRCVNMHKINRKIGPRITPVLATVIAFSYLLIAFNAIKSLLFATVYSTDGSTTVVWLFDGSLTYFQSPQHIILGCIAIVMFLLFILPAALTATFGDLLRRFIKQPWYLNFLDTFHGAFRFRFGFWFGVKLLSLTLIMVLKLTLLPQQVHSTIMCMSTAILIFQMTVQPYRGMRIKECISERIKEKYFTTRVQQNIANLLDNSYHLNIIILFAWIIFSQNEIKTPHIISLFVAYTEFAFIIVYHFVEHTPSGKFLITLGRRTNRCYAKWKEGRALRRDNRQGDSEKDPGSIHCWGIDDSNNNYDSDGNHDNSSNDQNDGDNHDNQQSRFNADDSIIPLYRTEYNVHIPTEVHVERNTELSAPLLV